MLEKFHKLQRKPKTMRIEGRIAVCIGRLTLETHQKDFVKRLGTCVGHTDGGQVQHRL